MNKYEIFLILSSSMPKWIFKNDTQSTILGGHNFEDKNNVIGFKEMVKNHPLVQKLMEFYE